MKAFAMFTTMMEKSTSTASTTTAPPPPIPEDSTAQIAIVHSVAEQSVSAPENDAALGEEQRQKVDLVEGLEQMRVGNERLAPVVEGEASIFYASVCEGETPAVFDEVVEGETPVGVLEGETPVISEKFVQGETPEWLVGSEALVSEQIVVGGESPVYIEGATPILSEEGAIPIADEVSEPKESGLNLVIDLDDKPASADSPVDTRAARRRARRNLSDEIEGLTLPIEEERLAPGAEGEQAVEVPRSGGEEDKAEERRLAAKRKRKGKHAATSRVNNSKQTKESKAVEAQLPAPTKVPFAKELVGPPSSSESEEEDIEESEEVLNFKPAEVWLTKGLLEAMGKFEDPKRTATYKERCSSGKLAKSGKRYVREELEEIDSDEEFRQYIVTRRYQQY